MNGESKAIELFAPKLLLGEGNDEVRLFSHFVTKLGLRDIQVLAYHGKDKLSRFLGSLKQLPGYSRVTAIATTRDADNDANAAFQAVVGALSQHGFPPPSEHARFTDGGDPSVGVFILPDGTRPGILESACYYSAVSPNESACVDEFLACMDGKTPRYHDDKSRCYAWLAAQERPGLRIGEAAEKGLWNLDNDGFRPLIAFLRAL